jgi:hypothetical protein
MAKTKKPTSSVPEVSALADFQDLLTVGRQPQVALSGEQQQLFKSFQSNLVSLLSHELRTPLMGILNALAALDRDGSPLGGLSTAEALEMARTQASRLESALTTVLDLAAWEAGALQVDLREGDFSALATEVFGKVRGSVAVTPSVLPVLPVLIDQGRLHRALLRLKELLSGLGAITEVSAPGPASLALTAKLSDPAAAELWDHLWRESQVARAAHASLPLHVFAGVLQGESGFLSRTREGLGAELHLVAQVLAGHEARFEARRDGLALRLELALPPIEGRARVLKLIQIRIWRPGLSEPAKLALQVFKKPAAGRFLIDGESWLEISAAEPRKGVRCPEDGVDAAGLLELALQSYIL